MEIDGREVQFLEGVSILRAAELNDITIPSLCAHKDLSAFGGCRLCMVEVEGTRGTPLACSTAATHGMVVRTDTPDLRASQRQVLQLLLSEHPSSCLVCGSECGPYMGTFKKSGVATGCRSCPADERCELQAVTRFLGVDSIDHPIIYRGLLPEREDPFFDRDYNLCILCGRCVRMCQEMRGTGVLAFNWRGSQAIVGPAFGRSHEDAGCEFCGACVSVCPTGALVEKASKWDGIPDGSVVSTCPFCAVGCQLHLWHAHGFYSSATPDLDPEVNDGQACVKGRFCMGELSHHPDRGRQPRLRKGAFWREVEWDEALDKAAEALGGAGPGGVAMVVSPDCTTETLYAAQKLVREGLGSAAVDCSARESLGNPLLWARLFQEPLSIRSVGTATRVLAVGLDTRLAFSIVGVELRKAMAQGARLVTVDPRESNLATYADLWLRPAPGQEGRIVEALASAWTGATTDLAEAASASGLDPAALAAAADLLGSGEDLTVVVGPDVFRCSDLAPLARGLLALADAAEVDLVPLYQGANTRGALEAGAFAEVLPGGVPAEDAASRTFRAGALRDGASPPEVLYLVGAVPFFERPECGTLIVQDIAEPAFECDVFLPASSYLEDGGSLINVEGRVQEVVAIEDLPAGVRYGRMRPDWLVFAQLAERMGLSGLDYASSDEIRAELARHLAGFPARGDRRTRTLDWVAGGPDLPAAGPPPEAGGDLVLVRVSGGFSHRGVDMGSLVAGLALLHLEAGFHLHPDDAAALGVAEGDPISVSAGGVEGVAPARLAHHVPRGAVYLVVPEATGGLPELAPLEPLFRLPHNPCPAEVRTHA